nr:T6SS effector BTH_I2691 family protein [Acinetobacter populi]
MPIRYVAIPTSSDDYQITLDEVNHEIDALYAEMVDFSFEKQMVLSEIIDEKNQETTSFEQSSDNNEQEGSTSEGTSSPPTLETITVKASKSSYSYLNSINEINAPAGYGFAQSFMRLGYLYVYLEHSNQLEEYIVSSQGYLKKLLNTKPNTHPDTEPCNNYGHRQVSRTITIPHIEELTNIYLCYSTVKWTEQVRANISNHLDIMKRIDAKAWLNGQSCQNIPPLLGGYNAIEMIEESFGGEKKKQAGFWGWFKRKQDVVDNDERFSQSVTITPQFQQKRDIIGLTEVDGLLYIKNEDSETEQKEQLLNARVAHLSESKKVELESNPIKKRAFMGMVVTLDDPTGLAMDIGGYIANFYTNALNDDKYFSDLERTAVHIETMRTQIKNQAIMADLADRRQDAFQNVGNNTISASVIAATAPHIYQQNKDKILGLDRLYPTANEVKQIENSAWAKYSPTINLSLFETNLNVAKTKETEIKQDAQPIEEWYKQILQTTEFKNVFTYHFDENDVFSQLSYLTVSTIILQGISVSEELINFVNDNYLKQEFKPENFVGNALVVNNPKIRAKFESLTLQRSDINLPSLVDAMRNYLLELPKPQLEVLFDYMGHLLVAISPAFSKVTGLLSTGFRREYTLLNGWLEAGDPRTVRRAYTWTGLASQFNIAMTELQLGLTTAAGPKRTAENLTKALDSATASQPNSAVAQMQNQAAALGDQRITVTFAIHDISNLNIRGSNSTVAHQFVSQFETSLLNVKELGKSSIAGFSDIAGGIFQGLFIGSAYRDMMRLKNAEMISKFTGTAIAMTYSMAGGVYSITAANAAKSYAMRGLVFTPNKLLEYIFKSSPIAKFVVIVTGAMTTWADIARGFKIMIGQNVLVGSAYFTGNILLFSGPVVWTFAKKGLIGKGTRNVATAMIVAGIALLFWSASKVRQEEVLAWLNASLLGQRLPNNLIAPFATFEHQMDKYKEIFS